MTVKEMYIRVINDLSALASQRNRRYSPEQVELELNVEIEEFVRQAVPEDPEGFFKVEGKYLDAIRPLIVSKDLLVSTLNAVSVEAFLPPGEQNILSVEASVHNLSACIPKNPNTYNASRIYRISLPQTPSGSSISLTMGGTTIYSRTLGSYPTKDAFHIINELEGSLDFVKGDLGYLEVTLEGATEVPVVLTVDSVEYAGVVILHRNISGFSDRDTQEVLPVRRIQDQMLPRVRATAYYRPTVRELICFLTQDRIKVNTPNNLIVNSLQVVYVRRPRKVSLALGIDCNLHPAVHQTICDRTVQRIRERLGDPKFQTGHTQNSNTL